MCSSMFIKKKLSKSVYITKMYQKKINSRVATMTRPTIFQRINDLFFSVSLITLLSVVFSRTACCKETEEKSKEKPKKKKYSLYLSHRVKAAKRKAMTEAARGELCKRRSLRTSRVKKLSTT